MNVQQNSYSRAKADGTLDLLGDAGFLEAYAATAKLLGTCFAYSPKEEASMRALAAIRSMDIASDWPFDAEAEDGTTGEMSMRVQAASLIEDGLSEDEASLAQEYQRLFVGPGHLAAAPWGSVYLDRDKVLYGCSWVELRAWMREHGVVVKYDEHVPEDQIGRILVLSAEVALQKRELLPELLGNHMLPWAGHYFRLVAGRRSPCNLQRFGAACARDDYRRANAIGNNARQSQAVSLTYAENSAWRRSESAS